MSLNDLDWRLAQARNEMTAYFQHHFDPDPSKALALTIATIVVLTINHQRYGGPLLDVPGEESCYYLGQRKLMPLLRDLKQVAWEYQTLSNTDHFEALRCVQSEVLRLIGSPDIAIPRA